jgi:hypothetical protein
MAHPQDHRPEPVQLDALPVSSAQASGDVELGPRIVTLYRLRLPQVTRSATSAAKLMTSQSGLFYEAVRSGFDS